MEINKQKLERVVETAKAKAAGNARWINAIDKAFEGLTGGAWIVTELADGLMITTESGETYHANGECQCKAYKLNQPCKHRAAAKLVANYNAAICTCAMHCPRSPHHDSGCCKRNCDCWCHNEETAPVAVPSPSDEVEMRIEHRQEAESAAIARAEILADATDAQRNKVLDLGGRAKLRGGDYTLRRDGKNIVVDDGKAWTVDRKGKVSWDDMANARIVKPQPAEVRYGGWMV